MLLKLISLALIPATLIFAQTDRPKADRICPIKLSMFPVTGNPDVPLDQQARFEIRACNEGYPVQLLGFRRGEKRPTLFIDTQQSSIGLLIHTGTVLFLQMEAGSSSPSYIAQFQHEIPKLIATVDGVGGVSYTEEHPRDGDYVVITVPRKTFPDANGRFLEVSPRRFRLKPWE